MKKISLKGIKDGLKRSEMKTISGGYGDWPSGNIPCAFDAMCYNNPSWPSTRCVNGWCVLG
ncbi:hypothetical protein [Flavobacterium anhuiense]|uniref:hypothetical protein n=1 Tax=Flavobacterium anhuiense TaxID=459526 RepID=UPI002026114C|nr:hypothetical protein [Flavobacterium anhuiense]URM37594.1 hypothetical protein LLY39_03210 [Flavobacterium anhuiense]